MTRVIMPDGQIGKMSILEKAARLIEPPRAELDKVVKPPEWSREARRIKQAVDVPEVAKALAPGPPKPTGIGVQVGQGMVFFTDGSLRHISAVAGVKKLTRAQKKAAKRLRHAKS